MEGYTVTILMFLFSGCICLSLGQVPVITNTRIARPVGVRKYFVVKNARIARPVRISYTSPTKQTRAPIVPKNPTECQASCPPDTQTLHIDHRQKEEYALDRTACICDGNQCGCCVHLTVARIGLDSVGCVNVTYLPYDMGFDFLMSVDGKTLLSSKVAVRSPPPICVGIPYLHHLASVCAKFQDLKRKDEKLSGCASIMVRFALAVLSEHDLGCFELPKESENTKNNELSSSFLRRQVRRWKTKARYKTHRAEEIHASNPDEEFRRLFNAKRQKIDYH
ncbi:hypothetical protein PoB_004489200 [Plakobranchus ocellatus]|uniref:DUF4773 domain-containing protein n=1 Tax=Plakobranchus ocellatus TaxID=259542 RepID=A0AAV4BGL0_9GAST|nr:hypothetical protein PoB_004489200 [Plakobranchus ocellatus]